MADKDRGPRALHYVPEDGELPPTAKDIQTAEAKTPARFNEWFPEVVRCFNGFKTTDAAFRSEMVRMSVLLNEIDADTRALRDASKFMVQAAGFLKFVGIGAGIVLVLWEIAARVGGTPW